MEQSLSTTQEQLSQRVSEVVKLEQTLRKVQTELKTMKERCASYEDEIAEQKDTIGECVGNSGKKEGLRREHNE